MANRLDSQFKSAAKFVGPLHGLLVSIKSSWADVVATMDSILVKALRAARGSFLSENNYATNRNNA